MIVDEKGIKRICVTGSDYVNIKDLNVLEVFEDTTS